MFTTANFGNVVTVIHWAYLDENVGRFGKICRQYTTNRSLTHARTIGKRDVHTKTRFLFRGQERKIFHWSLIERDGLMGSNDISEEDKSYESRFRVCLSRIQRRCTGSWTFLFIFLIHWVLDCVLRGVVKKATKSQVPDEIWY